MTQFRQRAAEEDAAATQARHTDSTASHVDLVDALECAWQAICRTYDATAELPEMQTLFEGAEPSSPTQAAETVVANMLLEVTENIPRFSASYKKPRGVVRVRDSATDRPRWFLSPEAIRQWQELLKPLSIAIGRSTGLILAGNLIDGLEMPAMPDEARVLAHCRCAPPRVILVNRSVLDCAEIVCDACRQPFRPA